MFFLAGQAATSALDLISTLQQTLAGKNSSTPSTPPANGQSFDVGASGAGGSTPSGGSSTSTAPLAPSTMDALLVAQGSNGQPPIVNGNAFSQQLFSLLDANGDGSISQSEFEAAIGQNGNTSKADAIFAQLDANHDGSVSPAELTNALSGQGQDAADGAQQAHHHHHHHHGMGGMGGTNSSSGSSDPNNPFSTSTSGSSGSPTDPFAADKSQTVTNADGSTTTTISYADGSQVTMTVPAASSTGGGGSSPAALAHNFIERMIQQQAQMMSATSAGQALAISA
jgi:hypothetical protein